MKALSQRAGALFAAGLLLAAAPARAESFAVNRAKTADRIDFKIDLQPWDAFSKANMAEAPREFSRGEVIRLVIRGAPRPGFHTYPLTTQYKGESGNVSEIHYGPNDAVQPLWPVAEAPAPGSAYVENDGWYLEHRKPFTWVQEFYVKRDAAVGPRHLDFTLHVEVCDESTCQFGDHEFDVPFSVIDGPPAEPSPDLQQRLQVSKAPPVRLIDAPPPPPKREANPPAVAAAKPAVVAGTPPPPGGPWDLLLFIWQGILWGALSLVTPCVFPMIPITVSYFLKQSEKSVGASLGAAPGAVPAARRGYSPVLLAAIYSATIALVLTLAGVLLLQFVQQFSQHWATNLILGGLFIFFALSLFGMYDIVLPSGLGRLTAAGEGRGGLVGVVFMALTFTVISFACVAPFYGGFIALSGASATAADRLKLVLGALAFSVTFALPFFILALFPSLLKALPKSGSWLNTVKVVMGFLELAAAFKFLRASEVNFLLTYFQAHSQFLTYDLVLGVYVALSAACGLYLLGVYRLPHDHGNHEALTVPRLLFSIAFLGLGLYLLPGLFKTADGDQQRPQGTVFAWLDAFLLPEDFGPPGGAPAGPGTAPASGRLAWGGDLEQGLKLGEEDKKLVFLDFTATICTNCKYNERSVFTQPQIKDLLGRYVLVHLYTDNVPPEYHSTMTGAQYHELQEERFKDDKLPLYAIVRPKEGGGFEIVDKYVEGKINNVEGFARFLQNPLQPQQAAARPRANGE